MFAFLFVKILTFSSNFLGKILRFGKKFVPLYSEKETKLNAKQN